MTGSKKIHFKKRFRPKYDMQDFNLCRHTLNLESNSSCIAPGQEWTPIAYPSLDPNSTGQPAVTRGLSFGGARFRYRYNCTDQSQNILQAICRIWSAVIVAPVDSGGAPLTGVAGLPVLGSSNGDQPNNVRILWRGLDCLLLRGTVTPTVGVANLNAVDRYIPVEHIKAKAFLKEGMGIFWVTELVTGLNSGVVLSLDLAMSLALRSVVR